MINCTCFCSPALQSAVSVAYWHRSWNSDLLEDIVAGKQNYHKMALTTVGEQKSNTNSWLLTTVGSNDSRWRLIMFLHKQGAISGHHSFPLSLQIKLRLQSTNLNKPKVTPNDYFLPSAWNFRTVLVKSHERFLNLFFWFLFQWFEVGRI